MEEFSQAIMRSPWADSAGAHRAENIGRMHGKMPREAVCKEQAQGLGSGWESQVFPGNLGFTEQSYLKTFFTGGEIEVKQAGSIEQMNLMHMRHIQQREQLLQLDACSRFFQRFPDCALGGGFTDFHKSGWQGPIAEARFDGAAAQQNLVVPDGQGADYIAGVLVVNRAAGIAHETLPVISRRNA